MTRRAHPFCRSSTRPCWAPMVRPKICMSKHISGAHIQDDPQRSCLRSGSGCHVLSRLGRVQVTSDLWTMPCYPMQFVYALSIFEEMLIQKLRRLFVTCLQVGGFDFILRLLLRESAKTPLLEPSVAFPMGVLLLVRICNMLLKSIPL